MASLDELRKQDLMKRAGTPPMPGMIERAFPNTFGAVRDRSSEIAAARQTGGLGAAVGQSIRTAVNPLIGFLADSAGGVKSALDPAAQALKTFATGDATPIGQSPLVAAAAKPPMAPAAYSNEGRNVPSPASPASPGTPAASPVGSNPLVKQIAPGIFRQGNSFSDSAAGAAEGAKPAPISAQNMAAADALAQRYATQNPLVQAAQPQQPQGGAYIPQDTGGFGLLDKGYQQRRSAMMDVASLKPGAGRALASLLQQQEDAPKLGLEREKAAQAGQESAADRLMRGQELNAKLGESAADRALKSQELADNRLTNDVKRQAAGVELTAAQRLSALQGEYLNAETDAARDAAAKKLQGLSGKAPAADWGVQVTPGVKNFDGSTTEGSVYKFNKATGEVQRVDGQKQAQAGSAVPPPDKRVVGAKSTVNGKTAVWDGTKWVPQ